MSHVADLPIKCAVVWASGLLEVRDDVPEGSVCVFHGEEAVVLSVVEATALYNRANEQWHVPCLFGLQQSKAMTALIKWRDWVKTLKVSGITFGAPVIASPRVAIGPTDV